MFNAGKNPLKNAATDSIKIMIPKTLKDIEGLPIQLGRLYYLTPDTPLIIKPKSPPKKTMTKASVKIALNMTILCT